MVVVGRVTIPARGAATDPDIACVARLANCIFDLEAWAHA
jgi:hypothetical protein